MNVLIIGSGGREHALAWKVMQSPRLSRLYIAPGNTGTMTCGENVDLNSDDHAAIIQFCKEKQIDIVLVGPEGPLAAGLPDSLSAAGVRCFGPKRAAAQIEASKVFAKNFMARHLIPTARYATFAQFEEALTYLKKLEHPIVLKASGLAAGKGVVLPETFDEAKATLESMLLNKTFGAAGREILIEERLSGEEVSLMAFTDGQTIVQMPAAQDHKRLLEGDRGPNTGGMGAYAPVPSFTASLMTEAVEMILKPAIQGMCEEGNPFVGVLYAGLILTSSGLRVLEFNCRFGDPETQAVLPLLETDLLEIAEACVDGKLKDLDVNWLNGASVCVVLASEGYPEKAATGNEVRIDALPANTICFHAGTRAEGRKIITSGGRALGLTGWADTLDAAVKQVYTSINQVSFDGMQYRRDIGQRALQSAYAESGVSIDAGNRAVNRMKSAVQSTHSPDVLAGIGSFSGLFDASILKAMTSPVLVASTDGVGTKVKLAAAVGRYRGIGHDIVNHCVNDILVQGGRPLFFMDYFAASKLDPEQVAEVVTGIAEACNEAGMALLGGETAEMPGVYCAEEFDVAATIVGIVERDAIMPRPNIHAGDVLIGLTSSGPHTNGYSLIRKAFADTPLNTVYPELGCSLTDALLAPHRSYLSALYPLLPNIKALAHITGGGFVENIPRVLPENLDAMIHPGSWPVPPLWNLIQQKGKVHPEEMFRVFNLGIGMIAIIDKSYAAEFQESISDATFIIGELLEGERRVLFAKQEILQSVE
ncbi:MAG TPA: phosphoribosylamine--glycine ligase [Anaerolineales bacterium]|nr:phosphoribosylamine--glycine ligase [Anaerolineales bacterium]